MPEPLASTDDLADRLGITLTPEQESRAFAVLTDASSVVRNYARQTFTLVEDDVAYIEGTAEQWLYLPERPVIEVTEISMGGAQLVDGQWNVQGDALFRYDGWNSRYYLSGGGWNQPNTIAVTYTHGYEVIPEDVIAVVCKIAQSTWLNPQGYRSANAGAVGVTFDSGTVGVGVLDADDKRVLDVYRRARRSVVLSAGLI
jgi:hypothetical protein